MVSFIFVSAQKLFLIRRVCCSRHNIHIGLDGGFSQPLAPEQVPSRLFREKPAQSYVPCLTGWCFGLTIKPTLPEYTEGGACLWKASRLQRGAFSSMRFDKRQANRPAHQNWATYLLIAVGVSNVAGGRHRDAGN